MFDLCRTSSDKYVRNIDGGVHCAELVPEEHSALFALLGNVVRRRACFCVRRVVSNTLLRYTRWLRSRGRAPRVKRDAPAMSPAATRF